MHIKLLSPAAFLSPKCTKYRLAAGRAPPVPAGGTYSAPQTLAELKGPTSKGRGEGGVEKEGKGRGGGGKEGRGERAGRGL